MDPSISNSLPPHIITKQEESSDDDDDSFTVPNVLEEAAGNRDEGKKKQEQHSNSSRAGGQEEAEPSSAPKSRRAKNPADREHRRLKRLLRNRVSAQQARERKKVYMSDLEFKANELYDKNSKLEERISTLTNENTMLRKVLMNTRLKPDGSLENQNNDSRTN